MNRRDTIRLAKTLRAEQARALTSMRIKGHKPAHFLSHLLRHEEEWRIEAKFGALTQDHREQRRNALVDVRVGSYRRDQVRGGGLKDNSTDAESYEMVRLPFAGQDDGLRFALWRLTEAKYREACDDLLHRKAVELNYLDEHASLPALLRRKAVEDLGWTEMPDFDRERWRDFAMRASASMKRYPLARDGYVRVRALNAIRIFASSEGTLILRCQPYRTVELYLWYLSKDGHTFPQSKTWFVTDPEELPSIADVRKAMKKLYAQASALASAPMLRSYSGPVLLDPKPAGLMVHEALGHRLEGNRLLSQGEGQTFRDARGQEVLMQGLSVRDDPRLESFDGQSLVGHYDYDDEGVEAGCANLIDDGTLRGFLTCRTPIEKSHQSNGHGRSAYHGRAISRMGVTIVEAEEGLDDSALMQAFLEEIREQEVPYGIRIMEAYGGETTTEAYDFQAFLGEIDLAARVYPDGRHELVRGVDFVGTPLNAVRGILAAGARQEIDNGFCGAESGYVPVSTISPALLVSDLELQAKDMRPMTQYAYPMPWEPAD